MFCPSCGEFNNDSSKFCKRCGINLLESHDVASNERKHEYASDYSEVNIDNISQPNKPMQSQNDKNEIASARKKVGIGIIIVALVLGLGGTFCSSELSNSYKPLSVQYGYRNPNTDETIIVDSGKIGGNYEAVSYYDSLKCLFIIGGIIIAAAGMFVYFSGVKYEKLPLQRKHGHVVGIDGFIASVEFDDGERSRLTYLSSKIVLVKGDKGFFEIKENKIIAFEREL